MVAIGSVAKELGLRDSVLRRWVEQRGGPAIAALNWLLRSSPSEFLHQSVCIVWLAMTLFHVSDLDPPMDFNLPGNEDGSCTSTTVGDFLVFVIVVLFVIFVDEPIAASAAEVA